MLELHQFRHSAFCLKVRMVLQAKGLSYRTVEVTPGIGQVAVFRIADGVQTVLGCTGRWQMSRALDGASPIVNLPH